LLIFFTDKGEHIMGLGRFLRKTVKAVGKNIGSVGKAVGKNIGSVRKAVGVRTSGGGGGRGFGGLSGAVGGALQAAEAQKIAQNAGADVSKEVQDAVDAQQKVVQAVGRTFKKGGLVSSGRGDGAAIRGKTKCKMY
jgi:hypothetical protein